MRRDRFVYEPANVRYCDTDAAKNVKFWSPSTSLNEMAVPPNRSPPLVTPTLMGGRPSRNIFSKRPLTRLLAGISVCVSGAWKSMTGPGSPKSAEAAAAIGSRSASVWMPYSPLK